MDADNRAQSPSASPAPTRRGVLASAAILAGGFGAGALARPPIASAAGSGDYISVTDPAYGAQGDGVTNDRAAIQDACNDAALAGGVVFFPTGTYMVDATTTIDVADNVQLVGVGRGSKIKCSNENTTSLLYLFRCEDRAKVAVRNLWLDGPEALGAGGEVRLIHHNGEDGALLVEDCYLRKGDTAIKVDSGAMPVTLSRCEITGQSGFGLLTSGAAAGDMKVSVRDCWMHDIGVATTDHPIYVPNNHSLDVRGCRFTDLSGYAVHVYGQTQGGAYCRVSDCLFDGAMRGAMVTNAYTLTHVSRCQIRTTGETSIKIYGPAHIVDCDFNSLSNDKWDIYNDAAGIPPYDVTIRGCTFTGTATGGKNIVIDHAGAHSWRIEACDFRGARTVNIFLDSALDSSASVHVVGNLWDQSTGVAYAIEASGLGNLVVEGNEFKELRGASGYAIRCASGKPSRLVIQDNDFSQDTADRSVSFAGTLPATFHSKGNYGPSGSLSWRDVASAATITLPPLGELFRITGTTNITSIGASWNGREITLRFASTPTVTDGSNLKLAGNFVATADDTIGLICDGTNWYEVRRSAN